MTRESILKHSIEANLLLICNEINIKDIKHKCIFNEYLSKNKGR